MAKKHSGQKTGGNVRGAKRQPDADAPSSQAPHEMDCLGAAVVVVDRSGSVLRASGWCAPTRRVVAVELDKRRFYSVSAGPLGAGGDGQAAALVLEITDAFGLGPREGDSIRELAHDLRTPLASMSGAVELLESGRLGQLTPEQVRLLGMLGKGMQMMLSLIDDATTRAKAAQAADGRGRATA